MKQEYGSTIPIIIAKDKLRKVKINNKNTI
jgi:hypothetical protein